MCVLDVLTSVCSFVCQRESSSCFYTIKNSWDVIEAEGQKKNGLSFLSETFRFCKYVLQISSSKTPFPLLCFNLGDSSRV